MGVNEAEVRMHRNGRWESLGVFEQAQITTDSGPGDWMYVSVEFKHYIKRSGFDRQKSAEEKLLVDGFRIISLDPEYPVTATVFFADTQELSIIRIEDVRPVWGASGEPVRRGPRASPSFKRGGTGRVSGR